jgi:hypothetical protein
MPLTLERLFERMGAHAEMSFKVRISYIEV